MAPGLFRFFIYSILVIGLGVICRASEASPIYVYKKGKGITFSDRPPPQGIEGQIFKPSKPGFSTFRVSTSRYIGPDYFAKRTKLNPAFEQIIDDASSEFGVDKSLIRAVIHAESGFNPRARSPKGALGLMQLMPGTARRHGVRKAFEPKDNIRGGTKYLAWLLRRFQGNLVYSIAAYNAGEGAVDQYGGIPPYSETKQYVKRVLALNARYKHWA